LLGGKPNDGIAREVKPAFRADTSCDRGEQAAFARSIGPEDDQNFSGAERNIHAEHDLNPAVEGV
jgi:hypothetical protein